MAVSFTLDIRFEWLSMVKMNEVVQIGIRFVDNYELNIQ